MVALLSYKPVYTKIAAFFDLVMPDSTESDERLKKLYAGQKIDDEVQNVDKRIEIPRVPSAVRDSVIEQQPAYPPTFGVWSGFKFGFGFAAGLLFFYVLLALISTVLFGAVISATLKGLTHPAIFPTLR